MKIDLTPHAGFDLFLEPSTLDVSTPGEVRFIEETRRVRDLRTVLFEPDALPEDTVLYWNYKLDRAGEAGPLFQQFGLTFGLVLLPSLQVGGEFVKTHGHYHSTMPGSTIGFPEVYTHYFGDLYLFMQRRAGGSDASLDDCVLYKMEPGRSIMIPPGYAHVLVNPSGGPALMGGLYSFKALHDYRPVREMRGGAYYFLAGKGLEEAMPNSRYASPPPLRKIECLAGTPFAPPEDTRPLWSSFMADPQRYAFITQPQLAESLFNAEDQSR